MSEQAAARERQEGEHVIREDNWPEYEAQHFWDTTIPDREAADIWLGAENVYVGDAWDEDAGKPLRHKPGFSLYTNDAGIAYASEHWDDWQAAHAEWRRRHAKDGS